MLELADLISNLTAAKGNVKQSKKAFLDEVGKEVVNAVKAGTPVDSGKLKDSIKYQIIENDTVEVVSDVEYAPYVDMGHVRGNSFVPGVHMFDKAMQKAEPIVAKEVDRLLNKLKILG